jgi:hypothetical protein
MGIDLYARWKNETEVELRAKVVARFGAHSGSVGYLREAYHGEPYATQALAPEAFARRGGVRIPAATLRRRLPKVLRLVEERERTLYGATTPDEIEPTLRSFRDFVALCEQKERETGEQVEILADW